MDVKYGGCTGGGIHYRGCTFITGGVASTSAASTTGGCTHFMHWGMCIPHKCTMGRSTTGGVPYM